jgi:hypothetical protein
MVVRHSVDPQPARSFIMTFFSTFTSLGAAALAVIAITVAPPLGTASTRAPSQLVAGPDMSAPRSAHTATALADGRVLIAGGGTEARSPVGAELYDPGAGRFVPLPPMVVTRHSHTATRLADGKVLLVGGYGAGSAVQAHAELFDPATNTFAPTGMLGAARAGHVAVTLPNGTVLIAGGVGPNWQFLSSAEVYDPATGRFSPTASMRVARESHVGVALTDGRVLIVGGHRGRRADIELFASTEIYDPVQQRFSPGSSMTTRRHKHDALLLPDGQVLVTAGSDERDDRGVYRSTEIFDARTSTFRAGPPTQLGRYKHAGSGVVLPSGLVLLAGGASQTELYDPRTHRFTVVASSERMAGQFSAAAPLPGGGVLITGGYGNGTGPRASAWVYRP